MTDALSDRLDAQPFVGLAVTFVHTGYNASIEFEDGQWSPNVFATSASGAIERVLREFGRVGVVEAPAPVVLAPPPY